MGSPRVRCDLETEQQQHVDDNFKSNSHPQVTFRPLLIKWRSPLCLLIAYAGFCSQAKHVCLSVSLSLSLCVSLSLSVTLSLSLSHILKADLWNSLSCVVKQKYMSGFSWTWLCESCHILLEIWHSTAHLSTLNIIFLICEIGFISVSTAYSRWEDSI